MKKLAFFAVALVALASLGWRYRLSVRSWLQPAPNVEVPAPITLAELRNGPTTNPTVSSTSNGSPLPNEKSPAANARPASFNLSVPFTTQAPHANWDYPYQEACEEAALLIVHFYWQEKSFTLDVADAEILRLVDVQNELLGSPDGYKDTDAAGTARVAEAAWPNAYSARIIYEFTAEDVEREVAAGRPVIAFFNGKALGNPNFRNGGPPYHALVIKGYTRTHFITHDVGTRNGADYVYTKQTIMDAAHEWNGGDVLNGRRAILILTPKR